MVNSLVGPSPGEPPDVDCRTELVRWFWTQLYVGQDPGETTWEELEALRSQVEAVLSRNPPDVSLAETYTAYAMALTAGMSNL
jgi:hypothetical protein